VSLRKKLLHPLWIKVGTVCVLFIGLAPVEAETRWTRIGSYANGSSYDTHIMSRLVSSSWDKNSNSKKVIFEVDLVGKDVGAMRVTALCKSRKVITQKKIASPSTGSDYFDDSALSHVATAIKTAIIHYCQ
jgi:hypothetical protein